MDSGAVAVAGVGGGGITAVEDEGGWRLSVDMSADGESGPSLWSEFGVPGVLVGGVAIATSAMMFECFEVEHRGKLCARNIYT